MKIGKRKYAESEGVAEATRGAARWRKAMLTVLVLLFTAVLSFAVGQVVPAVADEEGVLDGNTAEYTFLNGSHSTWTDGDGTEYYFPWVYDEETNTWSNGTAGFDFSPVPEQSGTTFYNTYDNFFLYITKSGRIAFDLVAVEMGTSVSGSLYKYITSIGDIDEGTIFERWSPENFLETERFEFDVTEGQTVRLWICCESVNTSNSFQIQGLKRPQEEYLNQQISFTANAGEHGSVAYGDQTGKTVSGSFLYSEEKTVQAIPEDGYIFSCWKDQYGAILPDGKELTLHKWDNETYTAEFIPEGATYDPTKWEYAEDGETYTSKTSAAKEEVTLSVGFYGNAVIFFDYMLPLKSQINVLLDGKYRYNNTYGIWYDTEAGDGNTWKPFAYQIEEETERTHRLEIRFKTTDSSIAQIKIRNIRIEDEPATTTMSVKYNEQLADVYVFPMIEYRSLSGDQSTGVDIRAKNSPYIVEKNRLGSEVQKTVVAGLRYAVVGIEKTQVPSTILPSQTVNTVLTSLCTDEGEAINKASSNILFQCFDEARSGYAISATFTDGKIDYLTTSTSSRGTVNGSVIQMNFEEVAPMPEVSAMVTAGGSTEPEMELHNGDTLYLPFGEDNSVNIVLSDYSVTEEYVSKTTYGGQTLQELGIALRSDVDKLYFTLPANIQENKDLVIVYGCEGYVDSDPFVVHIRIQPTGAMGGNLRYYGNIEIEDGGTLNGNSIGTNAWEFAPDCYDEELAGRYPYRALNFSNADTANSSYVSNLKLTVTGGGLLYFEVKMSGYGTNNTWLLYNFDKAINIRPTASGAATSGSNTGGKALLYTANTGANQVTIFNGMEDSVSLDSIGKDWYSVSVSMEVLLGGSVPEDTETVLYLAYGVVNNNGLQGEFVIRNIGYSQTESSITYGVKGEGAPSEALKVMAGVNPYVSASPINDGSRLTFTYTESGDYEFYAWIDGDANVLSFQTTYTYFVDGNDSVYAVVAQKDSYKLRIRGNFYGTLTDALDSATANDDIIFIRDYQLTAQEAGEGLTIPEKVNLIVPIDEEGTYYVEGGFCDRVIWEWESNYQYRKRVFTVDSGAKITVNGTIYIGGTLHRPNQSAQAHTSGDYSELILNGNIVVAKGGKFDTNGRVTGEGGITVQNGGSIYQPFLILDFSGGTNTSGLFVIYQTPFSRYAMINIQCKGGYTIEYGGVLYGHASLYALNTFTTIDQPFITYIGQNAAGENGITSLINLKNGAKAHVVYDNAHKKIPDNKSFTFNNTVDIGQTTITITGGATAGFMTFPFGITTKDVHFSIPYNYSLILEADEEGKNGNYEVLYDYKLMPGASIWVKKGATLTLNADLLVYDGFMQSDMSGKIYPTATELTTADYSATANLIVDGKLVIGKRVVETTQKPTPPVTFLGVVQTKELGATIEIDESAVLEGKIVDGGLTSYDCNYAEFDSSARIWIKPNGGAVTKLKAGTHYVSIATDEWTLPSITIRYARNCKQDEAADPDFPVISGDILNSGRAGHVYDNYTTQPGSGLHGAWMVEHGNAHQCTWELSAEEKNLNGEKVKVLTRTCTVEGCTEEVHRLLLAEDFAPTAPYKGSAFTEDDLAKLFCQHYFGNDTVPEEYSEYFSVDISFEGTLQGVNTYSVTVTLMNGFFGENTTSKAFTFAVTQYNLADLGKSAIESAIFEKHFTYDGTEKTLSTEELDEALRTAFGSDVSYSAKWGNNENAGSEATVTITGTGTNFTGTLTVTFSIAKAGIESVTISGANSFTYDGTAHSVKLTVTANGVNVTDADYDVHYSEDTTNVGTVTVTVTAKQDSKNFTGSGETSFTITRAQLTVTIEAKGHTYGQTPATLAYTLEGVQNGEEAIRKLITLQSEGAQQWADAETYDITAWYNTSTQITGSFEATNTDVLKNYTVTVLGGTGAYTVAKKDIKDASFEVTKSYAYDGTQKKPTMSEIQVTLSGYDGAHVVTYTVNENSYTNNIDATNDGKASFTVTANGNFTGTQTVEFTIGKATVDSVTVTGTYAYNGTELHPTVVVKSGSLTLDSDDYTVSFKHNSKAETAVKNAGEYTVTIELTDACKNYTLGDKTTATFTVEKADITITANDQHTPKGEEILSGDKLTWTVTKTAGGKGDFYEADRDTLKEHISVTTNANKDTIGNNYTITITWSDEYQPENYEVTFKNGKYSVDDTIWSGVSVTGYEQAIKYDGQVHKLTIEVGNSSLKTTITQKRNGEDFTGATDVGTYEVTVTITAKGYTTSFTGTYTITITAREVTVTFDSASSTYGDAVETTFTYQKSGDDVLEADQANFEAAIAAANPHTTATNTSEVGGKYTITADKPELKNYDITIVDGTYTINARPIEVTVNKQEVTYNQTAQSASSDEQYWSVVGLVNDDQASALNISLKATGTDAGNYDITASYSNANYTVTFKDTEGTEGNTIKDAFVIQAAALTEATAAECTYNGSEQTPTFTVKAGSLTVAAEHFTIEYAAGADRVNAGTVNVTIKPIGTNYTGSVETTFEIKAKKITVTLKAQTAEYSGEVPTPKDDAYTVNEGDICSQNGKKDDLGITITLVNGQKDVGSYGLDATASNENYDVNFVKDAKFEVTKKQITVTADNLESVYGDTVKKLTYTADGLIAGEAAEEVLTVTLSADRTIGEVGTYTITGSGSAKNYSFTVTSGTYTVNAREITVHINDQSALYSGTKPTVSQAQGDGWTVTESSIVDGDNLQITLTMEGVTAGDYAITASWNNDKNYKVTFEGSYEGGEKGTFTIQKRALTVVIEPQSATYDPAHSYTFDGAKWHVKDGGDGLAQNETKDILNVTLTKPTMTNAGKYNITGTWENENYAVTFEGGEDAYTVNKKDISEEGDFFIMADGESSVSGLLTVTFAGVDITITGYVLLGETPLDVTLVLDPDKITEIGDFDVTATVEDDNYSGSKTFHVVVKNADGYTKKLVDTLAELAELTEGMTAETLKAEDFEALKQVKALIAALDEEEKGLAEEQLAAYEALIAAWNESAEGLDAKIGTAQSVGDALLDGLFGVAATVSALAAVAFVLRKGGIL